MSATNDKSMDMQRQLAEPDTSLVAHEKSVAKLSTEPADNYAVYVLSMANNEEWLRKTRSLVQKNNILRNSTAEIVIFAVNGGNHEN